MFQPWREIHLFAVIGLFAVLVRCIAVSSKNSGQIPLDIFIYVSLYSAIPIAHWIWLQGGLSQPIVLAKIKQIIIPFIAGGVGLVFYITHFPEKLFKAGSVDILGASHQIWHVLIFLAMACWYQESTQSFAEESLCSRNHNHSPYSIRQ